MFLLSYVNPHVHVQVNALYPPFDKIYCMAIAGETCVIGWWSDARAHVWHMIHCGWHVLASTCRLCWYLLYFGVITGEFLPGSIKYCNGVFPWERQAG